MSTKDQMPPLPWENAEHGFDIAAWIEVRSDAEIGVAFHDYARIYAADQAKRIAELEATCRDLSDELEAANLKAHYASRQPVEAEPVACFVCDGTGKRTRHGGIGTYTCGQCNGSGKFAAPPPSTVKGEEFAAALDAAYPEPDTPHTSVKMRAIDQRNAFTRGWDAALLSQQGPDKTTVGMRLVAWNRAQSDPPIKIGREYAVAEAALSQQGEQAGHKEKQQKGGE